MVAENETKKRSRASVACASCRTRRTKCVITPGETKCKQCQRNGIECVIRHDDERKRPVTRAHVEFLATRVEILEKMLTQRGSSGPTEVEHDDELDTIEVDLDLDDSTHYSNPEVFDFQPQLEIPIQQTSSKVIQKESLRPKPRSQAQTTENFQESISPQSTSSGGSKLPVDHPISTGGRWDCNRVNGSSGDSKLLVDRLLSTEGHWNYNKSNGYTRYYSPTTNIHVYSDLHLGTSTKDVWEQKRRTDRIIRDLSSTTHDYLMELFWKLYNPVMPVVHKESFDRDRENGNKKYYSGFLHICMLAMGFRFADKSNPEIQKLTLEKRESTLHREAKHIIEYELDSPGDLTRVQALLILGDLEYGLGKDDSGWMYTGLACRLALDMGLNLDWTQLNITQEEVQIRYMVFFACIIYDKYWALWSGRSTYIRPTDLDIVRLANRRGILQAYLPIGHEKSLETQVYVAILELMELASYITENLVKSPKSDHSAIYSSIFTFDQALMTWYRKLAPPLRWTSENIEKAPQSFFLLHQQFHTLLIMAHRPLAQLGVTKATASADMNYRADLEYGALNHSIRLSQTVCLESAIQIAKITQNHLKRFNNSRIFITSMQLAGTAATAIIASLAKMKDSVEQVLPLQHLRILVDSLKDMSRIYKPAERMLDVLNHVIQDFHWNLDGLADPSSYVPRQAQSDSRETPSTESQSTPSDSASSQVNHEIGRNLTSMTNSAPQPQNSGMFMPYSTSDYNNMDLQFNVTNESHSRPRMISTSTDNQMMRTDKRNSRDFGPLDTTMLLSPQSNLMQNLDMTGPSNDNSIMVAQNSYLSGPLPSPDSLDESCQVKSLHQNSGFGMGRGQTPLFDRATNETQLSWDDIIQQIQDAVS